MYISLKDSCSKDFNKWSDAHQPEIKKDVLADGVTKWWPRVLVCRPSGLISHRSCPARVRSENEKSHPFSAGYERPAAYSASRSALNP
jgi:hypothetical protein